MSTPCPDPRAPTGLAWRDANSNIIYERRPLPQGGGLEVFRDDQQIEALLQRLGVLAPLRQRLQPGLDFEAAFAHNGELYWVIWFGKLGDSGWMLFHLIGSRDWAVLSEVQRNVCEVYYGC